MVGQPVGDVRAADRRSLLFRANVGAKYTSEYNTGSNLDPRKIQDALTLVNARIGFGADGRALDGRSCGRRT